MPGLGSFVHNQRKKNGFTRLSLAEGICSEKTIYYIEKDQRLPSVAILNSLGHRLGIDFFEYLPYIEYEEPELVKELLESMEDLRNSDCLDALKEIILKAEALVDFQKSELNNELQYNECFYQLFTETPVEQMKPILERKLIDLGIEWPKNLRYTSETQLLVQKYLNLLGICCFKLKEYHQAQSIFEWLARDVESIANIKRYQKHYISMNLNYINLLLNRAEYETACHVADNLKVKLFDCKKMDRLFHIYWSKGYALYKMGDIDGSTQEILKMIYAGLVCSDHHSFVDLKKNNEFRGFLSPILNEPVWMKHIEDAFKKWHISSID